MSGTRQAHRETPTQALRRRLSEAEAQLSQQPGLAELERLTRDNARLDATVRDLTQVLVSVSEHAFGDDAGTRILARRHADTDRWAVLDGALMAARFWGTDLAWHSTSGTVTAVMFPWSESDARRIARLLAGQELLPAEELAPVTVAAPAKEAADAPAEPASPLVPPVDWYEQAQILCDAGMAMTLEETQRHLNRIRGDFAAIRARARQAEQQAEARLAAEDDTITLPAPVDVPGYTPEPPDAPEPESPLTPLAASIPANTEQDTVALDVSRLHGPERTQVLPVVPLPPDAPPLPAAAPDVPPVAVLSEPLPPITWRGGMAVPLAQSPLVHLAKAAP